MGGLRKWLMAWFHRHFVADAETSERLDEVDRDIVIREVRGRMVHFLVLRDPVQREKYRKEVLEKLRGEDRAQEYIEQLEDVGEGKG